MARSSRAACIARQLLIVVLVLPALSALASPQAPAENSRRQSQPQRMQREAWFRRGRLAQAQGPSSLAPAAALLEHARRQKLGPPRNRVSGYALPSTAAQSAWTPLGPAPLLSNSSGSLGDQDYGPIAGRVTAVAVDPNDLSGKTVYIGAANGGVWKSNNAASTDPAAVTWTPLTDREATLSTGALAVQPGNSQLILVGTGDPNLALDSYQGLGILRSSDGGAHWNLISSADGGSAPFAGLGFSKISFSNLNPNVAVAGTSNFLFQPESSNSGRGLYYSADAGATWHSAILKDGTATTIPSSITDVAYNQAAGKFFAAMAWHGIYSSTDGVNWARLPNQPGGSVLSASLCPTVGASSCPILRGEIAVRSGKNEMYVWYVSGDLVYGDFADRGIWKTTDGGSTWTAISNDGIENCGDFEGCGAAEQGWYSLELAAVANGTGGTDLYAGATNIYKCSINTNNPTCSSRPFLNLTHAYGCTPVGSLAHVYPNQHAISFQVANNNALMYFGNDGGVYRALDGYGLSSSACGQTPNAFQSLNSTLGSLISLTSLSQHPTAAGTMLAGAQENGSGATDLSHSGANGTTWIAVNGGWGGATAINPRNPTQWFTADAGAGIQSCSKGIDCLAQDFNVVVSGATLGGDMGLFSTPYVLDPQASSRMLVGTCRLWRGNSNGSGFTAVSYNFDTGADTPCGGGEENLISAVATGGTPVGAAGSPVIYAGTVAGRIFVTTDASAGADPWYDATPAETGYPISSLVLDAADATGRTVYAGGMGFGVPHVWMSTDAGLSWTDLTGDLPDAPLNSLLLDPDDHQLLYAGTDLGVFSAQITGAGNVTWQELDIPAAGTLPNVPVTQLTMFRGDALKVLRAATYGRGAWELILSSPSPDYTLSLDNALLTLFPDQDGSFAGKLTALYGYNSPVTVSCEAASLPDVCTGETVTPTPAGRPSAVTVRHGSVADLSFNLKATGSDADATLHRAAATLRVVDFDLKFAPGTPAEPSLTVNSGSNTDSLNLMVQAEGSFIGSVILSCGGLPTDATCNFFPSNVISFSAAGSTAVSMFISSLENTPNTTAQAVSISATTAGAPAPKTQSLLLTVKNEPDYVPQLDPKTLNASPGNRVTAHLTVTAVHNYSGIVTVSCGASALAGMDCTVSPTAVYLTNATTGGATLTLTVPPTATAGTYTVAVEARDQNGSPTRTAYLTLTVISGFMMTASQKTVAVQQGGTATYTLQISPQGGAFNSPITLTCTGLPPNTTSSFNSSRVIPGSAGSTVTLNVVTSTVAAAIPASNRGLWLAMLLPMAGLFFAGAVRQRRRPWLAFALTPLLLGGLLCSCGGGGASSSSPIVPPTNTATPTGTYTLTVTGTSGAVSQAIDLTLMVQ